MGLCEDNTQAPPGPVHLPNHGCTLSLRKHSKPTLKWRQVTDGPQRIHIAEELFWGFVLFCVVFVCGT